jgi:putative spermidine/putrescine transport system permease protein/spermidine/putrescine transport system permease protein
MLDSKAYIRIFITTFKISFLTTLICVVIGYPLTYFMSQLPKKWAGVCMIGVLIPFWTSLLVRTYAWLVLLQKKGLLNNVLIDLEIIAEPIKFVHNTSGTLIGMAHIMLPFLILPLYANMRSIDKDCVRAAASLGATPSRAFWTVFFPLSVPGLLAGLLIVFVLCLGFYVTPAVLGGGRVIMAAMKISSNIELYFSWGAASALGVVLLVVTMAILFLASKLVSLDQISTRS